MNLMNIRVRNTRPTDFEGIIDLCRRVYPGCPPYCIEQLRSHLSVFPEGQFVAVDQVSGKVVGMSASLVLLWDDYDIRSGWRDFTDAGYFTNHDPKWGKTLYGAEIMVDPSLQGYGIGSRIYRAREKLAQELGLLRIRAGARLRGYHEVSEAMTAGEYVSKIVKGELTDPTLSFQLKRGFSVIAVTSDYLRNDPESMGYAAVIEWLNPHFSTLPHSNVTIDSLLYG